MPSAKREGGPLPPPPLCRTKDPEYRSSGKKKWRGSECVLSISNANDPLPPTLTAAATHYSSRRGHPHTYVLCPLPLLISTQGQPPPKKKATKGGLPPSLRYSPRSKVRVAGTFVPIAEDTIPRIKYASPWVLCTRTFCVNTHTETG